MANTKVTKAVLADDAVGLAQLDITNDPSNGQALTASDDGTGSYNLTWASVSGTTINNNADNRVITGSGTANTLNGESSFTFDGTKVGIGTSSGAGKLTNYTSANRQQSFQGANGDLDIISDNNSAPVVYIKGTGTADLLNVFDNTTEVFSIQDGGQVLIGQDSGDAFNDDSMLRIQRTGDRVFQQFKCDADQNVQILFGDVDDDVECSIQYHPSDKDLRFTTGNNAEALRIDDSQRLLIGTTNSSSTATDTGLVLTDGHILSRSSAQAGIFKRTSSNGIIFIFRNTVDTRVGTIETSSSSTSYNTSSDYRLKENVSYDWDATTRLKQLKPARFNWIEDETNTVVDGFLAHEVSDIVPEAISGEKDAVDEDGNPDYQGIDQSKLVPLLVKTIQELEARIETLESN